MKGKTNIKLKVTVEVEKSCNKWELELVIRNQIIKIYFQFITYFTIHVACGLLLS